MRLDVDVERLKRGRLENYVSVTGRDNPTCSHCLRCLLHLHKGYQSFLNVSELNLFAKEWTGRVSAQSLNSELKMATPPGDEIWAQKCHELDFQVTLLTNVD